MLVRYYISEKIRILKTKHRPQKIQDHIVNGIQTFDDAQHNGFTINYIEQIDLHLRDMNNQILKNILHISVHTMFCFVPLNIRSFSKSQFCHVNMQLNHYEM